MATKTFKIGLSNTDKQNMAQDVYERLLALTFPEYDSAESYSVGDFVVYNDQLYKCIGATSGAWDNTKWQLATLNDLLTDIEDAVQFVNDKANVDGNYPTLTAGLADNLTPYGEDSGAEQDNPFISNGTGTNNNSEIVTVGDYGLFKEKRGNTVVVNQLFIDAHASDDSIVIAANQGFGEMSTVTLISGHKYLLMFKLNDTASGANLRFGYWNKSWSFVDVKNNLLSDSLSAGWKYYLITTGTISNYRYTSLQNSTGGSIDIGYPKLIDLTQWFNGDIPSDLESNPENFFRYYQGSLAYNTGSLVNSNGVRLVSTGRNLWDEETELGVYSGGVKVSDSNYIRSKNQFIVVPNKTYYYYVGSNVVDPYIVAVFYDKDGNWIGNITVNKNSTFDTPQNACYMAFYVNNSYGTTYNHDITISLYYSPEEGGKGYDKYYPYEEPYVVETGNEQLLAFDAKTPNGVWNKNTGEYTFTGNETWTFDSDNNHFSCSIGLSIRDGYNVIIVPNGIVVKVVNNTILRVYLSDNPQLTSSSNMNQIFANGTKMQYLKLSPTTEQGTPFAENLPINDYGMLYWLDSSNNIVGIPQGAKIFYPVNYKGFVDDLYSRVDGDASKYVVQDELIGLVTQEDLTSNIVHALTNIFTKLIKTGDNVTLSLEVQNDTGNIITAGTTIATLPEGTYNAWYGQRITGLLTNDLTVFTINTDGTIKCSQDIQAQDSIVTINISYNVN